MTIPSYKHITFLAVQTRRSDRLTSFLPISILRSIPGRNYSGIPAINRLVRHPPNSPQCRTRPTVRCRRAESRWFRPEWTDQTGEWPQEAAGLPAASAGVSEIGSKRGDSLKESGKTAERKWRKNAWRSTQRRCMNLGHTGGPQVSLAGYPLSSNMVEIPVAVSVQLGQAIGQASGHRFSHTDASFSALRCR